MGVSRGNTGAASRAGSVAREILKRRDKPFKFDANAVAGGKKKGLDVHTSFRSAPQGYTFLPVGTPDLAERCKEISKQKHLPLYVVNTKPYNKHAADPKSISHHIARIGYHFSAGVVDEACQQLNYILHRGRFIKEADLQAQAEQSRIAKTMAKHGLRVDKPDTHETPSQVRAAIKELFPKIPDHDLDEIVRHAWEKGSERVGTKEEISLPRRVQLATIARIRHEYTDYDLLLKAFGDWRQVRDTVEPECLRKLIEWRGELDAEADDDELHEIVRETIVIPDDEEADMRRAVGTDGDSSGVEVGETSDASVEVVRKVAADDDLAAESVDEGSNRFRHWPRPRDAQQMQDWNDITRRKIGDMRRQIYNAPPPGRIPVAVQPNARGELPNAIVVNGQVFQRAPPQLEEPAHQIHSYAVSRRRSGPSYNVPLASNAASPYHGNIAGLDLRDRPIASIESQDRSARASPVTHPAHHRSFSYVDQRQPMPSDIGHVEKRRRVDYGPGADARHVLDYQYAPLHTTARDGGDSNRYPHQRTYEAIDQATSQRPQLHARIEPHQIRRIVIPDTHDEGYLSGKPAQDPSMHDVSRYPQHYTSHRPPTDVPYGLPPAAERYDPSRPLIHPEAHDPLSHHSQRHIYPPYIQTPSYSKSQPDLRFHEITPQDQLDRPQGTRGVYPDPPIQRVTYLHPEARLPKPPTYQPRHGAPAPIQHISGRDLVPKTGSQGKVDYRRQPSVPVNGAPHPAQPYHT